MKLFLNFEAFNISNSWSPTAMTIQEYAETTRGVVTLTPGALGMGSTDGGNPSPAPTGQRPHQF